MWVAQAEELQKEMADFGEDEDEMEDDAPAAPSRSSTPDDPFAEGDENAHDDPLEEDDPPVKADTRLPALTRAVAPSFQSTSLGPALYLASLNLPYTPSSQNENLGLPYLSHSEWMDTLSEGGEMGVEALEALLERAGMGDPLMVDDDDEEGEGRPDAPQHRKTCDLLARRAASLCPAAPPSTSLTRQYSLRRSPQPSHPTTSLPLPYHLFPPGMLYFSGVGGLEKGDKACVVHANYATGSKKEELLRERGLWALRGDGVGQEWTCDAEVMRRA